MAPQRKRFDGGNGGGDGRGVARTAVPGVAEPRVPHAAERRARHGRPAGEHPAHRRAARLCAALRDCGEHLLGLVNDVLDFAKLGAGRVELHPAPVDVEDLLRGVVRAAVSPRAHEKGLEIAWAAPADARRDPRRRGPAAPDPVQLRRQRGEVHRDRRRADRRRAPGAAAAAALRFIVDDTGPGVAADAARAHLRGLRPGRHRRTQPARRRGPGPGHRAPAGRGHGRRGRRRRPPRRAARASGSRPAFPPSAGRRASRRPGRPHACGVVSPNPIVREAARRQIEACGGRAVAAGRPRRALAATRRRRDPGRPRRWRRPRRLAPAGRRPRHRPAGAGRARPASRRYRRAGFAGYLIKPLRRASLAERVLAAAGADARPAGRRRRGRADRRGRGAGPRVLLVEDNPINALLARALLTREGCAVDHAGQRRGGDRRGQGRRATT